MSMKGVKAFKHRKLKRQDRYTVRLDDGTERRFDTLDRANRYAISNSDRGNAALYRDGRKKAVAIFAWIGGTEAAGQESDNMQGAVESAPDNTSNEGSAPLPGHPLRGRSSTGGYASLTAASDDLKGGME